MTDNGTNQIVSQLRSYCSLLQDEGEAAAREKKSSPSSRRGRKAALTP